MGGHELYVWSYTSSSEGGDVLLFRAVNPDFSPCTPIHLEWGGSNITFDPRPVMMTDTGEEQALLQLEFDSSCDEVKISSSSSSSSVIVFCNQTHLTCAQYLPSKRLLCTGDREGTVRRCFVTRKPTDDYSFDAHPFTFDSHSGQVNCIRLSRDGTYCLSASEDTTLYYFDLFPRERTAMVVMCYAMRLRDGSILAVLPRLKSMLM